MKKKIKSVSNPHLSLNILDESDVKRIHTATLEIIESTGIRFPSKKALDIWRAHGAHVDHDTMIVKVPAHIIEEALKKAPPGFTLAARDPSLDLPLDGNHVYVGTDGCGVEIIDIESGGRRRSYLRDVGQIARVADAMEEIAFHFAPVAAQDCPAETRGLHELAAIWQNSTKHVQTESIYNEQEARASIEMTSILAGGRNALRERPLLSIMECTISPLAHDAGSLEAALVAAEAGVPVGFMTMASCASTAPTTMAGNLVVGNAEVISALALIQLVYPGAPVYYAAAQTAMDLRSGAYTGGGPEDFLFGAATNKLADFYNLPLSMGSFATGAKEPDWQAGIENCLSTFMASAVMSDMLLGVGLLNGSTIWSYEQMMKDCEIFGIIRKMMDGIIVNDVTLALDVIKDIGPAGHFLTHEHTVKRMRELWVSGLFDRRPYAEWEQKGDGASDWAREKARNILATHQPEPLDPKLETEIQKVIRSVENDNG